MASLNVESEVVKYLAAKYTSWPVSTKKPKSLPQQFIMVDRTGGPREAMVLDQAEVLIEVYHKTSQETASDLANDIADNIHELLQVDNITRAKVNSLIRLDDTIAQYERYQVYCDVFLRR